MLRTTVGRAALLAILCWVAVPVAAGDVGFSAGIGLEVSYAPLPPASYAIESDLRLSLSVPGFGLESMTTFDLSGFVEERVAILVDVGAVQIGEEIRFAPIFAWNDLSVDIHIAGVGIGFNWILGNIGSVQTPEFAMAMIVELSSQVACGFTLTSLTGFGAVDLVRMLGGDEAPFSVELLSLFEHLAYLVGPAAAIDVTLIPGFTFAEQLVRLTVDFDGLIASQTTWFDAGGLDAMQFELGYRFADPALRLLVGASLDGAFSMTGLTFVVDVQIDVVRATSWTVFAQPAFPFPLPIVFERQGFAVSFEICGVTVTSETDFNDSFLFAAEILAIEAVIPPVTFTSVTTFDGGGFASESLRAEVSFSGVTLFSRAQFSWSGIDLAAFGFRVSF